MIPREIMWSCVPLKNAGISTLIGFAITATLLYFLNGIALLIAATCIIICSSLPPSLSPFDSYLSSFFKHFLTLLLSSQHF